MPPPRRWSPHRPISPISAAALTSNRKTSATRRRRRGWSRCTKRFRDSPHRHACPTLIASAASKDNDRDEALEYRSEGPPGKTEVVPTKPTATQRDLALAYTPGVAK